MTVFLTGRSVLALSLSVVCGNVILWRTIDDLSPVLCLCLLYYRQAHALLGRKHIRRSAFVAVL